MGFPGGSDDKESACTAGELGLIPVWERSSGEGNGKPLQYFGLENPMNSMKRQKDRTLKDELLRLVSAQLLLVISGEITPERMKGCSQSKN